MTVSDILSVVTPYTEIRIGKDGEEITRYDWHNEMPSELMDKEVDNIGTYLYKFEGDYYTGHKPYIYINIK